MIGTAVVTGVFTMASTGIAGTVGMQVATTDRIPADTTMSTGAITTTSIVLATMIGVRSLGRCLGRQLRWRGVLDCSALLES